MTSAAARPWRWVIAAAVLCTAAAFPSPAAAQPLAVPFLPQSEDLCGGAAAAMVMRYWGAADVYPDAFAPLLDRAARGIRVTDLVGDLERRAWSVAAGSGSTADLARELGRGRPVIALIEDRPGRFHYVVVVGVAGDRVTLHDPARGPLRALPVARFDAAWQKSERWMLILLPPAPSAAPGLPQRGADRGPEASVDATSDTPTATVTPCAKLVQDAVGQAAADRAASRRLLRDATTQCPGAAAPWRELAGLDALDRDWTAAAAHARQAVALDPADGYAWRILATAEYVQHDDRAALAAWNRIGEPVVHLIDVKGLRDTRYAIIADAIGVELKSMLTPAALDRGERRLRDVPSIAAARLAYHPVEGRRVQIDASVLERDRAPSGYPALIRAGFDAVTDREVSTAFSNVTGGGDVAGAAWRWWEHRPMVSAFYAAPAPRTIGGGTWRVDLSRETQTFGRTPFEETRTRAAMALANWLTGRTRVSGAAAFERWHSRANDVAISGGVEHWRFANRVRLAADVTQALGRDGFAAAQVTAAVRSKTGTAGFIAVGMAGYAAATSSSPASMWPGADTGHARDILLRAHPLLDDGIVTGGAFGRRLAFASAEGQRWTTLAHLPVPWAPAVFVDAARASKGLDSADERLFVDAGAGLRFALPGAATMRIDLAHGVREGGWVLSAGWDRRWR